MGFSKLYHTILTMKFFIDLRQVDALSVLWRSLLLHVTDGIDYDTMASRALTYNQYAALNITYTDLALHGNSLYV